MIIVTDSRTIIKVERKGVLTYVTRSVAGEDPIESVALTDNCVDKVSALVDHGSDGRIVVAGGKLTVPEHMRKEVMSAIFDEMDFPAAASSTAAQLRIANLIRLAQAQDMFPVESSDAVEALRSDDVKRELGIPRVVRVKGDRYPELRFPDFDAAADPDGRAYPMSLSVFAEWLFDGYRGTPSESAIVRHLTGLDAPNEDGGAVPDYPCTPADFRLCEALLERVPEARRRFGVMSDVSPQWARLVDDWDELRELSEQDSQQSGGDDGRLAERLSEIIGKGSGE